MCNAKRPDIYIGEMNKSHNSHKTLAQNLEPIRFYRINESSLKQYVDNDKLKRSLLNGSKNDVSNNSSSTTQPI